MANFWTGVKEAGTWLRDKASGIAFFTAVFILILLYLQFVVEWQWTGLILLRHVAVIVLFLAVSVWIYSLATGLGRKQEDANDAEKPEVQR